MVVVGVREVAVAPTPNNASVRSRGGDDPSVRFTMVIGMTFPFRLALNCCAVSGKARQGIRQRLFAK